jgi:hypothetical protein
MLLSGAAALLTGCATQPPGIDTVPGAEATFDGLYPLTGTKADAAWARPGADFSEYSKIAFAELDIQYRPGGESGRTGASRSRGGAYVVTDEQRRRLDALVTSIFMEELAKSEEFELVGARGPGVLVVEASLLDVVSYVPPDPPGRTAFYLRSVGEATLVLELRDGETNAVLARAVDRRAAEDAGSTLRRATPAMNAQQVGRVARIWAASLTARLDELAGLAR